MESKALADLGIEVNKFAEQFDIPGFDAHSIDLPRDDAHDSANVG